MDILDLLAKHIGTPAIIMALAAVAYDRLQTVMKRTDHLEEQVGALHSQVAYLKGHMENLE